MRARARASDDETTHTANNDDDDYNRCAAPRIDPPPPPPPPPCVVPSRRLQLPDDDDHQRVAEANAGQSVASTGAGRLAPATDRLKPPTTSTVGATAAASRPTI